MSDSIVWSTIDDDGSLVLGAFVGASVGAFVGADDGLLDGELLVGSLVVGGDVGNGVGELLVGLLVVGGDVEGWVVGRGVGFDEEAISVGVGVEIIAVNCGDGSSVLGEIEGNLLGLRSADVESAVGVEEVKSVSV